MSQANDTGATDTGAAAATAAAATGADAGAASAAAALAEKPFYESFQDADLKTYAANFKTPEEVVARAKRFDAFKDADPENLAILPKDAKPEAMVPLLEKLGAPTEAAAYGFDKLEGVDPDFAKSAADWMKDARILPWQANLLAAKQMEFQAAADAKFTAEAKAAAEREMAGLQAEWGGEYTAKLELGRRAARAAGLTQETIESIETFAGAGAVLRAFAFFGSQMREGAFVDGAGSSGAPSNPLAAWYPEDVKRDEDRARGR